MNAGFWIFGGILMLGLFIFALRYKGDKAKKR